MKKTNANSIPIVSVVLGCLFLFGFLAMPSFSSAPQPESPAHYFKFIPGTDGMLVDYESLIGYLEKLAATSPRIKLEKIGLSPLGKPMYIAFISAAENIKNLPGLKEINRRLALDDTIPAAEREELFKVGRVFVLASLSMHAEEVGPSQAAAPIAYDLAFTQDPQKLKWLNDVVYMMVPCHNPDGMDMVVEHYRKYKGSKYEGSGFPGLYHKYVGHDNNRDFVTLSQQDNKVISAISDLNWFPQVMVEKHQMGKRGPRYFVPPFADPIAENIDAGIWNWTGIFGANMMKDMTAAGLAGVSQHYLFDDYWPGSTETCIWKNVIGLLTEAAPVKQASPIFIEPNELIVEGKGLSEYKKSVNMPLPWPGGWWRLGDILQYEFASTMSIIKTASCHAKDILRFRNDLCRKEVETGKTQPPFYYLLPLRQHDQSELVNLVNLLKEHGIIIYQLTTDTTVAGQNYSKGDIVIPMAQPFRPFIKEVMEAQQYPVRHYTPDGQVIEPYDITSWSLPLHMGVFAVAIEQKNLVPGDFDHQLKRIEGSFSLSGSVPDHFYAVLFPASHNESFKAAFRAIKEGFAVSRLDKRVLLPKATFNPGSFVIYSNEKNSSLLKLFLQQLSVQPSFIYESKKLEATPVIIPRIALVESYFDDMDAGWTRFVFDTYGLPFKVLNPGEFEGTDFSKNFDIVIFPDSSKDILIDGKDKVHDTYYDSDMPPQFTRGIGKKGFNNLLLFLDSGGIILSWGNSTALFMGDLVLERPQQPKEEFQLPVDDISATLEKNEFDCPGSLLKLDLLEGHPLTLGLPKQIGVFFQGKRAFSTTIPDQDMDRRVIGKFPEQDILLSGYCQKVEKIGNQCGLVWLKKNKGQLVLFGFPPQFRASIPATYKLLFNAILLPPLKY